MARKKDGVFMPGNEAWSNVLLQVCIKIIILEPWQEYRHSLLIVSVLSV